MISKLKEPTKPIFDPKSLPPVWEGPGGEGPNGGITYSLLSRYLTCRERFRIRVVEGLKPEEHYSNAIEFGNMWHEAEEEFARLGKYDADHIARTMLQYSKGLAVKYPMDREKIEHYYKVGVALFEEYVKYWEAHPDMLNKKPLLQEATFDVWYTLPSGRRIRLRGKMDAVHGVGPGKTVNEVLIQENKTKSQIDQNNLTRRCSFDLQSNLYLIALQEYDEDQTVATAVTNARSLGVLYNVIKRSTHRSVESMMKKIEDDREDHRLGEWFARWKCTPTRGEMDRFKDECFHPMLESLCDWWEVISNERNRGYQFNPQRPCDHLYPVRHFRHPFGCENYIDEYGGSDLDEYIMTSSTVGLRRVETLFPELQPKETE